MTKRLGYAIHHQISSELLQPLVLIMPFTMRLFYN